MPTTRVWVRMTAPRAARAGGQRDGEPRRVEPAVGRQPDAAQDALGGHQREPLLGLAAA